MRRGGVRARSRTSASAASQVVVSAVRGEPQPLPFTAEHQRCADRQTAGVAAAVEGLPLPTRRFRFTGDGLAGLRVGTASATRTGWPPAVKSAAASWATALVTPLPPLENPISEAQRASASC